MKKAFTLVEVIILLVIFTMVALLVIPLSVDDTIQARNISKWKQVQSGFSNIPEVIRISNKPVSKESFESNLKNLHPFNKLVLYKIKYMNGSIPVPEHSFDKIYTTNSGATVAYNWYKEPIIDSTGQNIYGILMYDVNGKHGSNIWGKDIFGFYIYNQELRPLGQGLGREEIEFDCSRQGTGLYCSTYYLQGGDF